MHSNTGIVLSRRGWMALAGGAVFSIRLSGANTDFWNKKDHSAWTEDEIQILLTKSPWAKEGLLMPKPGARGSSGLGEDGVGVNGIGLGVGGRQERQEGRTTAPPPAEGVVVWESAQVILDARKRPLSKEFKDHYTLSVRGVPWRWEGDKSLDQWRQFTTLRPGDQPPVQPGAVQKAVGDPGAVLLGFSKDVLVLSANDKSIHFTTEVGLTVLKTKFDTKEMRYQGHLSL
jgi:hypothetical protein